MSTPQAPLDRLHAQCLSLRQKIRTRVAQARSVVAQWEPAPYDPTHDFGDDGREILPGLPEDWRAEHGVLPDHAKVWDADDPLLRPRPWLR